jgi:hypothetical protein
MLIRNEWQPKGQWRIETVRGLIFADNVKPPWLPLYVLVEFDEYTGLSVVPDEDIVSIVPRTVSVDGHSDKTGSRRQLPFILGWTLTIHKSHGLTLERLIVNLGNLESSFGISYVECSRLKSLSGLAFERSFRWERMQKINNQKTWKSSVRR